MEATPDYESRDVKRAELVADFRALLGVDASEHAERIVNAFCSVSPPLEPPMVIEMITLHSGGRRGGNSRKPGNIVLNWRRLVQDSADLVLTGAGVVATPWLIPLAALSIFNKLWAHSSIDVSREQAACLFAMWHHRDENNRIEIDRAHSESAALFEVFTWPSLGRAEFDAVLHDLVQMRCVELPGAGTIWLREWVRTSYH